MLRSMTGFGTATEEAGPLRVLVEIKAVNGRFLKSMFRLPTLLQSRENELEALLRRDVHRGSLTVTVRWERVDGAAVVAIDEAAVRAYQDVFRRLRLPEDRIPTLPGVVAPPPEVLGPGEWPLVENAFRQALSALLEMRGREGAALADVVAGHCDEVDRLRLQVRERAPVVVRDYQQRLQERVNALLAASGAVLDPATLAREVAVWADRSDVTEEVDRLGSHTAQARALLVDGREVGRRLEFLTQEMLREINTVGSKSADASLTTWVVELKSVVERLKEQVANIE